MRTVRPAAVAGTFYPRDAATLRAMLGDCLAQARERAPQPGASVPKLLVVPHAGYVYSGPVAAHAYALLGGDAARRIRRVVLLGPAHRVPLAGLALPTVDAFETPLGTVPLDPDARGALAGLRQVLHDDRAHAFEHSLEVQLPFLQAVLPEPFTLVPLAVGDAGPDAVAQVLARLWGGDETLIVISSDLSHYLPYDEARRVDARTAQRIGAGATDLHGREACGAHALNGALQEAARQGLAAPRLLDLRNSGDTAGDRSRVVGYAAFAMDRATGAAAQRADETAHEHEHAAPDPDPALGPALLAVARNAIADPLGLALEDEPFHAALADPGANFVTLKDAQGKLRGCIGNPEPTDALAQALRRHAHAAAFHDPRFDPLRAHECAGLALEVSLLSAGTPLPGAATLHGAAATLRPGTHGVTLQWRGARATLLPQVWRQLPDPVEFLRVLCRKAGLPGGWHGGIELAAFTVRSFTGPGPAARAA